MPEEPPAARTGVSWAVQVRPRSVLRKALAYEPEQRYPTVAALGAALDGWLEVDRPAWWKAFRHR
jgi:hypothetical protein